MDTYTGDTQSSNKNYIYKEQIVIEKNVEFFSTEKPEHKF